MCQPQEAENPDLLLLSDLQLAVFKHWDTVLVWLNEHFAPHAPTSFINTCTSTTKLSNVASTLQSLFGSHYSLLDLPDVYRQEVLHAGWGPP